MISNAKINMTMPNQKRVDRFVRGQKCLQQRMSEFLDQIWRQCTSQQSQIIRKEIPKSRASMYFIAEYNHHIVFIFCTRNCILSSNMITKFCFLLPFLSFMQHFRSMSIYFYHFYHLSSIFCSLSLLFLTNFIFTDSWH